MATRANIKRIIEASIPEEEKARRATAIDPLIDEAIISLAQKRPWWWRINYADIPVTSATTIYDAPDRCERISVEGIAVIDSNENPIAIIDYIPVKKFNRLFIQDPNRYNSDGYPEFYTIMPKEGNSDKQAFRFLGDPTSAFTARLFFIREAATTDIHFISSSVAIAQYILAGADWLEDVSKHVALYQEEVKNMIDHDEADVSDFPTFELDDRAIVTFDYIKEKQERL